MSDVEPKGEARGYSWAPFQPGHELSLKHGAWSPRTVRPIAEAVEAELGRVAPWTGADAFAGARASYAWAEAQAVQLRADLDEHGYVDEEGQERATVRSLDRIEGRLGRLRDALGLSPQALGKLLATAASVAGATGDAESLASLQAEGRRILASRLTTPDDMPAAIGEEGSTDG